MGQILVHMSHLQRDSHVKYRREEAGNLQIYHQEKHLD